jgi:crotonobetainyl-CoA:carnitine CoA-transferase CaiB-like acyl-CoA transferase
VLISGSIETLHARTEARAVLAVGYGRRGAGAARDTTSITRDDRRLDQFAGGKTAIPNLQIGDLLGGTLSALSTLLIALLAAQRGGEGARVDVAMTDGLLAHHFFPHTDVDAGIDPVAERTLLTGGAACYRVYTTADGKHGGRRPELKFCSSARPRARRVEGSSLVAG